MPTPGRALNDNRLTGGLRPPTIPPRFGRLGEVVCPPVAENKMRITKVEPIILRLPHVTEAVDGTQDDLLIRIETDEGIYGWGEVDSSPEVARAIVEAPTSHGIAHGLRQVLLGRDPFDIEQLWRDMYRATIYYGREAVVIHAMSGVDMALWDILGKATCKPVHKLLGGSYRSKACAYASVLMPETAAEAQRMARELQQEAPVLDTPERIAELLREENRLYDVEHFQVVLLNTRRKLVRVEEISQGTLDTILVHPREVFKLAIAANASAIVLAHNHPSGDPTPSEADIKVTRDLIRAGQLLKIEVLDHVIIGKRTAERTKDFVSLRELGYFYS